MTEDIIARIDRALAENEAPPPDQVTYEEYAAVFAPIHAELAGHRLQRGWLSRWLRRHR